MGVRVAVNYLRSRDAAERVCEHIREAGGTAEPFRADVRREDDVVELVEAVSGSLGPGRDWVFNATGPQPLLSLEEQTWQAYLDQLEFFVKSPLLLLKQLLPAMKAQNFGRIVQIASEVVELGNPRFASYVAAKFLALTCHRQVACSV
jgi:3-oxoacyl-[acyl-carrier protein] reductase